MVPPWNRIGAAARSRLATLGFAGLSCHGPRPAAVQDGLHVVNVHIDVMDWSNRAFAGDGAVLAQAIDHLAARRTGRADADEPTGLMTHHRDHDDAASAFLDRFVTAVRDHDAARWLDSANLFGADRAAA
jgi:hypothetical protein